MKLKPGLPAEFVGRINYALSKQVPDMEKGFKIHTNYGVISITAREAPAFARLAEQMLLSKIYE
jgi:hypothetical protein